MKVLKLGSGALQLTKKEERENGATAARSHRETRAREKPIQVQRRHLSKRYRSGLLARPDPTLTGSTNTLGSKIKLIAPIKARESMKALHTTKIILSRAIS